MPPSSAQVKILAQLKFNSTRKRSSVIAQFEDQSLMLLFERAQIALSAFTTSSDQTTAFDRHRVSTLFGCGIVVFACLHPWCDARLADLYSP
eukprot:3331621-Amphidinium_carterae.1